MAANPNLISGIHNYCDRWCERCDFTSRCIVFAREQEDPELDPATYDLDNEAFAEKLSSIFAETRERVEQWAAENDVDLSEATLNEVDDEISDRRKRSREHPLALEAEQYAHEVEDWFRNAHLAQLASIDENSGRIDECLTIIRWYQFFISVKLNRALISRIEDGEVEDEVGDAEGSAKAALIAIDKSITAWRLCADLRREDKSFARSIVVKLEGLRNSTEHEFPRARDFIRPGFDEVTLIQ